ncbi:MAG TPA: histidine phosphatase family protein [Acidobacteriota bacterium]|nr:histidine phosphatase family protein [Acidobacteriota bacterium]
MHQTQGPVFSRHQVDALHWILRIGFVLDFLGHGTYGFLQKASFVPYLGFVGIPPDVGRDLLPYIGAHDYLIALAVLFAPNRAVLLWGGVWGLWTALLRPLTGESWWEVLDRAGNFGMPLALLLLAGPPRAPRAWFERVREWRLPGAGQGLFAWTLRITTACCLVGHGAYAAIQQKEILARHWASVGVGSDPLGPIPFLAAVGWFEIGLGAWVLLRPSPLLLAFVTVFKVGTELLYPVSGLPPLLPVLEFIERAGSYVSPLALALMLRWEAAGASVRSAPARALRASFVLLVPLVLVVAAAPPARSAWSESPPDSVVVDLLRRGDLVMLVRHAATDRGQRDASLVDVAVRSAQRNLSALGRAQADSIGRAVRALGLPIGPVRSSPMYRCRDTAEIAFGSADTTSHLFVKSPASREVRIGWLATPRTDGRILVLVTHQDPYLPLLHLERDELREGDVLLIRPDGEGRWSLLARLSPADWTRLAARFHA